jgi:arginase
MLKLVENKSEIGAGTRGASLGVDALKVVSRSKEDYFFNLFESVKIQNENSLLDKETDYPFAKRIDGLVKVYERTAASVSSILKNKDFPLILSGDHACAGGTIAGIKMAYPKKRLGVIWIDAHADLHTPYTTPSGNLHGMPLATALGVNNEDFQINDIKDKTLEHWESLKNMGGLKHKVKAEDLVFISVRDTEVPEDKFIQKNNIKNYTVQEVREKTQEKVAEEIENRLANCDIIYVSFDVDSMDSILVSKGTGTPVENGLTPNEAEYFVTYFAGLQKVKCIEFVEINPCLDNKVNTMAETAYDILVKTATVIINR